MGSRKRSLLSDSDMSPLYKEWDEALCPICMDHPHNAVLIICSSHDKSCRPFICDTSYRHSNCLDRFKKLKEDNADGSSATTLVPGIHQDSISTSSGNLDSTSSSFFLTDRASQDSEEQEGSLRGRLGLAEIDMEKSKVSNLRCPLCRGRVLGWKVVEEARKYLNRKSRSCSNESCLFSGDYRELRGHARRVHPTVRPADVDPSRERDWRRLEDQTEYSDIVSAVRSAMPGAVVVGDYMIESRDRVLGEDESGNGGGGDGSRWLSTLFFLQMFGSLELGEGLRGGRSRLLSRHRRRASGTSSRRRFLWGENVFGRHDDEDEDEDELEVNIPSDVGPRRRQRLTRSQSDEDQQ